MNAEYVKVNKFSMLTFPTFPKAAIIAGGA